MTMGWSAAILKGLQLRTSWLFSTCFCLRSVNLKLLFGILNSSKKSTKNQPNYHDTSGRIVFVHFLEELKTPKRHFEIDWPLPGPDLCTDQLYDVLTQKTQINLVCTFAILRPIDIFSRLCKGKRFGTFLWRCKIFRIKFSSLHSN